MVNKQYETKVQKMANKQRLIIQLLLVFVAGIAQGGIEIRTEANTPSQQRLAAKEIARYLYLRTGTLPEKSALDGRIVIATKEAKLVTDAAVRSAAAGLKAQQYLIKTTTTDAKKTWWIVGGDDVGALYGAYRFLEHLGIRFYLHQDVVPETKLASLPDVEDVGKPLFELRGLNPWGSHAEGNDTWDTDEYKAVFTQMTKMRMNSMLIHSYPGVPFSVEPAVWVGLPQDVDEQGRVKHSPTPSYFNTLRNGQWGYKALKTGQYSFGGSLLFEDDVWGSDVLKGYMPFPTTVEGRNDVFNRMGGKFSNAFSYARSLGIKMSLGSEGGRDKIGIPVMMRPKEVLDRLKELGKDPKDPAVIQEIYEGIFTRIARTHPLDYYVIHTQEGWYWQPFTKQLFDSMVEEWKIALRAWEKVKPPFGLAACGWVLGPDFDHAAFDKALPKHVAMSEMSRAYNAPVDEAFAHIQGRQKWAIPWIEEDSPILTPQLWAGRVRKDAADALAYGCTGLMTLHWRTLINEPAATAVAQAGWDQSGWNPEFGKENPAPPPSTYPLDKISVLDKPYKHTTVFLWGEKGSKFKPRALPVGDLYSDWASANFGPEVAESAAAIFTRIDGFMPLSSTWNSTQVASGAGSLSPDHRPWSFTSAEYDFVDQFEKLRPKVKGAGNQQRFNFWSNQFRYTRAMARACCVWGEYMDVQNLYKQTDVAKQRSFVIEKVVPKHLEFLSAVEETYALLLASITDLGGIQTLLNWEGHNRLLKINDYAEWLTKYLGDDLKVNVFPSKTYKGDPRVIVPTVRNILEKDEPLRLKVIVLDNKPVASATLCWRPIGEKPFRETKIQHVARAVYHIELPSPGSDFEYYIDARTAEGKSLVWPVTTPQQNQTVVVWETK